MNHPNSGMMYTDYGRLYHNVLVNIMEYLDTI